MKAHKIRLFPTQEQEVLLRKSCGVARFSYNWALAEWNQMYASKEKVNEAILRKKLNSIKEEAFPWMSEVTKCAPEQAIKNLGTAFSKFFKKKAKYPVFKKKGVNDRFYISNDTFYVKEKNIKLPKIGKVKMAEELRFSGKIMSGVVSLDVDRWYIAISMEIDESIERKEDLGIIGVDLGIKTLATLSDGVVFENPKFYSKALKRIKKLSRRLAKKKKGSKNREKAKVLLAKNHRKVRLARKTNLHKLTTYLCNSYSTIVLEDLNVAGMVRNHKLAGSLQDSSFGMLRRFIEYKAPRTRANVVFADRFYPSSKLCSGCGNIKHDLKLSDRIYRCERCGLVIDRDLNASINLKKLGTCCSKVKSVDMEALAYLSLMKISETIMDEAEKESRTYQTLLI